MFLQATSIELPAVDGWNSVCVFKFCAPIIVHFLVLFQGLAIYHKAPLAAPSMTHTGGEKHSEESKSVTALTKTCQRAGGVCVELQACAVWIADWKPWLVETLLCSC